MIGLTKPPAQQVKKYLDAYGDTVQLSSNGTTFSEEYRAFLRPLRYKNKMYLDGTCSIIGHVDQSYYLYIGPADKNICGLPVTAKVRCGNIYYCCTRAEKVTLSNEVVYMWGVVRIVVN